MYMIQKRPERRNELALCVETTSQLYQWANFADFQSYLHPSLTLEVQCAMLVYYRLWILFSVLKISLQNQTCKLRDESYKYASL